MIQVPATYIVEAYLMAGYDVLYVDADDKRREEILLLNKELDTPSVVKVIKPVLSGEALIHYSVVVFVNEDTYDENVRKELMMIPGVTEGRLPILIKVSF